MYVKKECIAMLLAGGQGSRLYDLTKQIAKPAVSFGGKYKIIDFPLSNCINSGIDTLILGCTHYPLIRSTVGKVMGEGVTLVNPAYETAIELKNLLKKNQILQDEKPALGTNQYQFFVSDGAEKFQYFANTIFKYGVLAVKQINIEEY